MREKILIIDNEPEMLMLLSRLIRENTPYVPVATNNPFEALEMVRKEEIGLVISELKMPGLDGLEVLEEVGKADDNIPVIISSAYGTAGSAIEARRKGVFDFIMKPFRSDRMLYTIERAFDWRNLRKENRMLRERLREYGFKAPVAA